jgi:deazaflavin-dependent oxidoreductase (nitroreductase family)
VGRKPGVVTIAEPVNRDERLIADLRANSGTVEGEGSLVIVTTTGAKTGRLHVKPLCVHEDGADLIIAASMGGAPNHPQWYRNLTANPQVTVEYLGETYQAEAETVPNSLDRNRLFQLMSEEISTLYAFQDKCRNDRQIPIVRLRRG